MLYHRIVLHCRLVGHVHVEEWLPPNTDGLEQTKPDGLAARQINGLAGHGAVREEVPADGLALVPGNLGQDDVHDLRFAMDVLVSKTS